MLPGLGSSGPDSPTARRDSLTGSDYKRQGLSMSQFYGSSPQLGPIGMPSAGGSLTPPPSQSGLGGLGLGKRCLQAFLNSCFIYLFNFFLNLHNVYMMDRGCQGYTKVLKLSSYDMYNQTPANNKKYSYIIIKSRLYS